MWTSRLTVTPAWDPIPLYPTRPDRELRCGAGVRAARGRSTQITDGSEPTSQTCGTDLAHPTTCPFQRPSVIVAFVMKLAFGYCSFSHVFPFDS